MKIGPVSQQVEPTKVERDVQNVCNEFEGVFLRQLLTVAKVGDQGGSGYGPMIVDSLATAIGEAGGLGLAGKIQEALLSTEAGVGSSK
jgi:Rod binding domain-containing protein